MKLQKVAFDFTLILGLSAIFLGCAQIPDKPNVALCTMDWPRQQGICFMTGPAVHDVKDLAPEAIRSQIDDGFKVPLEKMDRSIMFTPADWQTVSDYLKKLREVAERNCGQ